ncbi:MAG: hypothetical protein AAF664_17950 [Planctomycetota bacterium]
MAPTDSTTNASSFGLLRDWTPTISEDFALPVWGDESGLEEGQRLAFYSDVTAQLGLGNESENSIAGFLK